MYGNIPYLTTEIKIKICWLESLIRNPAQATTESRTIQHWFYTDSDRDIVINMPAACCTLCKS